MKPGPVLIAVPTRGTFRAETVQWLLVRRTDALVYGITFSIGNAGVERQRNDLVRIFLKSPATHLFFLDDDVVPPKNALSWLMSIDRDIVTGIVPLPLEGIQAGVSRLLEPVAPLTIPTDRVLFERLPVKPSGLELIGGCSGGCMLIKRHVFETIPEPWFDFPTYAAPEYRMGEDMYFCYKAQLHGFEVWADWSVKCEHYRVSRLTV